ncbi:MAG: hypothetical protein R3208_06965 [Ketobacteraceae bacterium]|nr:hypothetical protein [Ketobacteraceae bacterium]
MTKDASQIQENLAKALEVALDMTLREAQSDSHWTFKRESSVNHFGMDHCIVLTISAFRFRVMVIMHLSFNDKIRSFLADIMGAKLQELDDDKLIDRLLEISNSFCGHIKRHLQETCPALGMSTPNLLDSACLALDDVVDIAHEAHIKAINSQGSEPLFGATALVSLLDNVNFKINQPNTADQGGGDFESFGELELF